MEENITVCDPGRKELYLYGARADILQTVYQGRFTYDT